MVSFADYLARQIYLGRLDKDKVFATYPSEKEEIEEKLKKLEIIPVDIEE